MNGGYPQNENGGYVPNPGDYQKYAVGYRQHPGNYQQPENEARHVDESEARAREELEILIQHESPGTETVC